MVLEVDEREVSANIAPAHAVISLQLVFVQTALLLAHAVIRSPHDLHNNVLTLNLNRHCLAKLVRLVVGNNDIVRNFVAFERLFKVRGLWQEHLFECIVAPFIPLA